MANGDAANIGTKGSTAVAVAVAVEAAVASLDQRTEVRRNKSSVKRPGKGCARAVVCF